MVMKHSYNSEFYATFLKTIYDILIVTKENDYFKLGGLISEPLTGKKTFDDNRIELLRELFISQRYINILNWYDRYDLVKVIAKQSVSFLTKVATHQNPNVEELIQCIIKRDMDTLKTIHKKVMPSESQLFFTENQAAIAANWWLFIIKNDLPKILAQLNQTEERPIQITTAQEEIFLNYLIQLIWAQCQSSVLHSKGQSPFYVDYLFAKEAMDVAAIQIESEEVIADVVAIISQDGFVSYQNGVCQGELYPKGVANEVTSRFKNDSGLSGLGDDRNIEYCSGADKYQVLATLQNDYVLFILGTIFEKKQQNSAWINSEDIIEHSSTVRNFYTKLGGLETIPHLKNKKEDIQHIIKKYINNILVALEIANTDSATKLINACKTHYGNEFTLSLFKRLIEPKTYPDIELEEQISVIEQADLNRKIHGIAILLHLKPVPVSLNDCTQCLLQEINRLIHPVKVKPQSIPVQTNKPSSAAQDPMNIFTQFFGNSPTFFPFESSPPQKPKANVHNDFATLTKFIREYPGKVIKNNQNSSNPLMKAIAQCESVLQIKSIIDENPGIVRSKDSDGNNPIHLAVLIPREDCTQLFALLHRSGVSLHEPNKQGMSPAHLVVTVDNVPAISVLSAMGVQFDESANIQFGC